MTPGAHLQETIQALRDQESLWDQGRYVPSDRFLQSFFRARRYMGSGDRRQIAHLFYEALRHQQTLLWWLKKLTGRSEETFSGEEKSRWKVFAPGILSKKWTLRDLMSLCMDKYAPSPLTSFEEKVLSLLERQEGWYTPSMPSWVRGNYPAFLDPFFQERFGEEKDRETDALMEEAPLDLRINSLKTTREHVQKALSEKGISSLLTPFTPWGLRIQGRPPLAQWDLFKEGYFEVQDGASQLVSLLTQAQPGQTVLDFCAGAGGKTLGLAACMQNKGILIATDIYEKRLLEAKTRFRRNGVHNVQTRPLDPTHDSWLKRQKGRFDRVLVDAPCSGSGTWRRNPDLRWRFAPSDFQKILGEQREILTRTGPLVKPGGRLIYATCSLFSQENENQVDHFLEENKDFTLLPLEEIWKETLPGPCPFPDKTLKTTPYLHKVDGFFTAILQRKT